MEVELYFAVTVIIPLLLQLPLILNKGTRLKMFIVCLFTDIILSVLEVASVAALIATETDYMWTYLLTLVIVYIVLQTIILAIASKLLKIPKFKRKILVTYIFPIFLVSLQILGAML